MLHPAGTKVTVSVGDYFVLPPLATGEVRNDGDEVVSLSVAVLFPAATELPDATPTG